MAKVNLTEVCDIQYGYPFDSCGFSTTSEDGMPLIRIRDVKTGYSETYFKGDFPKDYIIHKGDYLVGMDGEFNIAPWQSEDALLNQRVCKISSKCNNVSVHYIYRFLTKELKKIEDETPFVTVKHLSAKRLNQVKPDIPPLPEQERIVAELDLLTGIIDKQKSQLKELDNLAQSIFYDMFGDPVENEKGWEVKTFGEVGTLQRGAGLSKKDLTECGYPCILYGQIHTRFGEFTNSHIACIPTELVHTAKIAHRNDVIMAITSEDVEGSCKSTAWMGDYDIAIGSDAAIYHHTQNGIYVSFYTKTKAFYNEKEKYARGFKVTHISTKEISQIPLLIPPMSLQNSFSQKIQSIESQKESINRSIAETQKLFDYTMDKYFG